MIEKYLSAQQIWFTEQARHWSSCSEPYTGADSLITALREGWQLNTVVYQHNFPHGGCRSTAVYTFTLYLQTEIRQMSIISTPLILRLLAEEPFTVLQEEPSKRVDDAEERSLPYKTAV